MLLVLAATGILQQFGISSEIFDIREMVFVQVREKCAFVMAVRAAEKCGGNVRSSFFLSIIFIFIVGLCGGETVHLNIDFVQFL